MISIETPYMVKILNNYNEHKNTEMLLNDFHKICKYDNSTSPIIEEDSRLNKEIYQKEEAETNISTNSFKNNQNSPGGNSSELEIHLSLDTIKTTENNKSLDNDTESEGFQSPDDSILKKYKNTRLLQKRLSKNKDMDIAGERRSSKKYETLKNLNKFYISPKSKLKVLHHDI